MKHFMLPKSISPLSELSTPTNPNPNNSNPNSQKSKSSGHHRKQKCPPRDKENSDPCDVIAGKPSPAGKLKSPLPPRPPPSANPLKRKLSNDAVFDVAGPCSSSLIDSGVKVVVRMRPLNKDERDGEMIVKKVSNDSLTINDHTFTFDSVADMEATQLDIFQLVGAPLVENCIAGFNSSVFAYGQTGSGKTYTMWGPSNALLEDNLANEQQGLTPRVFERLFARINEEQIKHSDKQLTYQCRCSFLEIYNEQITDLLDPSQKNLQIREDVKSGVYVENLAEEYVSTAKDVIRLLLKGLSHRRTGATSINAESSRSHSVFTCSIESQCKSMSDGLSSLKTSKINLVDLAGSERQKLTGAAGERLKEAGNINRSLSQLGNLINILAEVSQTGKQRHIPYRDSRLTFLLQESLGGNAKMAMICAISPAQSCKSETFSTLRFAQRAKAIKNKAVVNEVMQEDDVNFLREVIRQLKDELLRMKANRNQSDPKAAYANSWNARRSLSLLKMSLNHPMVLHHLDADGDEEMEIDEEAVKKLCNVVRQQSGGLENSQCKDECIEKPSSEISDVSMEEVISEIDDNEIIVDGGNLLAAEGKDTVKIENKAVSESQCKLIEDGSAFLSSPANMADAEATNSPSNGPLDTLVPEVNVIPCDVSPILPSPPKSVSPRIVSSSRKSLRTSSMLTASQKDVENFGLSKKDAHASLAKSSLRNSQLALTIMSGNNARSSTDHLAASLHRGLEIIDNQRMSSAFRKSAFRLSFKLAELKPILPVEKVDVGIQTLPDSIEMPEIDGINYLCSNCNKSLNGDVKEANDPSNLQLVPVDRSVSAEKPKNQVPKAVEKVLAGAIRREMALEDFCSRQNYEIAQLNRLVQQYKHERECNAIISQMREDKIIRLEHLMDGVLPTEDFMEEEFISVRREHELLKEKYENHPEVLETKIELKRAQDELEKLRSFFDMDEKDVLLEEIHDLRSQLQYYTDSSPKASRQRKSLLKLTYPCEQSLSQPLNTIPESTEDNAVKQERIQWAVEQERIRWTEVESQWISLAEELKLELESCRNHTEDLERELESEKKCSEELKEALQLAMEGQARMLEQHADLEEKHMQMLARRRQMQDGIEDVKKAAAKAGVRGAESKFINALAAEISALKVERERERRYFRDENKMLQSQLRDTAEALQAAGELLVRLKEGEEAVAAAEKRAAVAEEETEKTLKQIDELKKKHETEIESLNQVIADSHIAKEALQDSYHAPSVIKFDTEERHSIPKEALQDSYHAPSGVKFDTEERQSGGDERWKEEFQAFYDNGIDDELSSKFAEPSSWFSGYDRCNI
ncbi:kinesin-like protein KIN-12B [Chenopodium quinoa]|uniref:kinesin-like protein KIN-12B n=1 Tax=Chenopodium quinoa TaxID=63459 RepID=UPI000B77B0F0|nr:kinesin-like protein KIN-12B [Chenopodium quinoa]